MAKCKHHSKPASDNINRLGMNCDFECPKGADMWCNVRKPKRTVTVKPKLWSTTMDSFGYFKDITYGGITVLQLNPGTERNEEMVMSIVRVLNNNYCVVPIARKYLKGDKCPKRS